MRNRQPSDWKRKLESYVCKWLLCSASRVNSSLNLSAPICLSSLVKAPCRESQGQGSCFPSNFKLRWTILGWYSKTCLLDPRPVLGMERTEARNGNRPRACCEVADPSSMLTLAPCRTGLEPWKVEKREWWPLPWEPPWWAQCIPYGKTGLNMASVGFICASLLFRTLDWPRIEQTRLKITSLRSR